jgi:hypothetical protein
LRLARADVDGRGMRLVVAGREVTLYKRVSATNSESAVAVGGVAMSCSFMILYSIVIRFFSTAFFDLKNQNPKKCFFCFLSRL